MFKKERYYYIPYLKEGGKANAVLHASFGKPSLISIYKDCPGEDIVIVGCIEIDKKEYNALVERAKIIKKNQNWIPSPQKPPVDYGQRVGLND